MHRLLPRRLLAATLFLTLACSALAQDFPRASPQRLGFDPDRLERLDAVLQSYVDREQVAGSVALVLRNGRVAYAAAKGMSDVEAGRPMQPDSIFRIASQTKAIVSTGIMILHERGQLNIADPLSRFFPEWADPRVAEPDGEGGYALAPLSRPITLRDLLTHTSGIGYGTGGPAADEWRKAGIQNWYFADRDEPIRETVRRMAALPLEAQPGERWIYGYSIDILGAVIENASGLSLADFLQREIFDPLGMEDTHFYLPPEKAERLVTVYGADENGLVRQPDGAGMQRQGNYLEGPRVSFSGGAGLLSTASDYARFLQMTLNGGEFDGVRLLSPKTVELMTVSHLGDIVFRPGVGMGLGFSVVEDLGDRGELGSEGEYGWGGAYHSTYWVDPEEGLVVVYLTQLIPAGGIDDFARLRAGIYGALVE